MLAIEAVEYERCRLKELVFGCFVQKTIGSAAERAVSYYVHRVLLNVVD